LGNKLLDKNDSSLTFETIILEKHLDDKHFFRKKLFLRRNLYVEIFLVKFQKIKAIKIASLDKIKVLQKLIISLTLRSSLEIVTAYSQFDP
jgi:hypothetical protein